MKKIINYEKDILFKTIIGEISSISLEHDFTVDDDYLRGDFIIAGEYKTNELSINKEAFNYRLPLEYELEKTVDINTLNYEVENFEYNVNDDVLTVYIDFGVRYEEKELEPIIPKITEEEINSEEEVLFDDKSILNNVVDEQEDTRLNEEEKQNIIKSTNDNDDTYITYHVHIVREGESLESIASKYNTTIEVIKEYNEIDSLELKSKLIIPDKLNE